MQHEILLQKSLLCMEIECRNIVPIMVKEYCTTQIYLQIFGPHTESLPLVTNYFSIFFFLVNSCPFYPPEAASIRRPPGMSS